MSLLGSVFGGGDKKKGSGKGSVSGKSTRRLPAKKPATIRVMPKQPTEAAPPSETATTRIPAPSAGSDASRAKAGPQKLGSKAIFRSVSTQPSESARKKRTSMKGKQIGSLLLKREVITEDQLQKALTMQDQEGGLIGQILVRLQFCTRADIGAAINKQRTITTVILDNVQFDADAMALVPRAFCDKYRLVPFEKIGNFLCVAMSNVLDAAAKTELKDMTQLQIKTFDADWREIQAAIETNYPKTEATPAAQSSASPTIEPLDPILEEEIDIELPAEEEILVSNVPTQTAPVVAAAAAAVAPPAAKPTPPPAPAAAPKPAPAKVEPPKIEPAKPVPAPAPTAKAPAPVKPAATAAPAAAAPKTPDTALIPKAPPPPPPPPPKAQPVAAAPAEEAVLELEEVALPAAEPAAEAEEIADLAALGISEVEDLDAAGIEELPAETGPEAAVETLPVEELAEAPAGAFPAGPLKAIPVSADFFAAVVKAKRADPVRRWQVERRGPQVLPVEPAPQWP